MKCFSLAMAASLVVIGLGCSNDTKPAPKSAKSEPAEHEHVHGTGLNGGIVFDFGAHHAEFKVDHAKQQCTLFILGADEKTPTPVAAKEIILNTKATKTAEGKAVAPMTITLQPVGAVDGKASKFVGTDAGLGNVAEFEGTVSSELEGKPAMGEFKE